jgi:hypothetical protein
VRPTRFDAVVATTMATAFGTLAFFLVGAEVFTWTVLFVPVLGPVLVGAAGLGGVWLAVRGRRSAKGFGAGMIVGWVLLAFWTSGMSVGIFP